MVGAQNFALFFFLVPLEIFLFVVSLGVFSWIEVQGPSKVHVWSSPAALSGGAAGESPNVKKTTPKFNEKTSRENTKSEILGGRRKKDRNVWQSGGGGSSGGGFETGGREGLAAGEKETYCRNPKTSKNMKKRFRNQKFKKAFSQKQIFRRGVAKDLCSMNDEAPRARLWCQLRNHLLACIGIDSDNSTIRQWSRLQEHGEGRQEAARDIRNKLRRDIRREFNAKLRMVNRLLAGFFVRGKQTLEMQLQDGLLRTSGLPQRVNMAVKSVATTTTMPMSNDNV